MLYAASTISIVYKYRVTEFDTPVKMINIAFPPDGFPHPAVTDEKSPLPYSRGDHGLDKD